jgi:hypothetical protein
MSFMDMHLAGVRLTSVYLTGVHLAGVYLTGVFFAGVHLASVYLTGLPRGSYSESEVAPGPNLLPKLHP